MLYAKKTFRMFVLFRSFGTILFDEWVSLKRRMLLILARRKSSRLKATPAFA